MTCALPEIVVPIAFCSSAALDEDSMSGTTRCNMSARKAGRAKDVDRSDDRRGR